MRRLGIVGGGVAGLALGATVDPRLWQTTIYEQRPDRSPSGTALGMWPGAMEALEVIGLASQVRARSVPVDTLTVRDGSGDALISRCGPTAHLIARPDLLATLEDSQHAEIVRSTCRIHSLDEIAGHHDVVVGADGVHSVVRRCVFGAASASVRAGWVVIRGIAAVPRDDFTEDWSGGLIVGLTPMTGSRTNFYIAMPATAELEDVDRWDGAHTLQVARELTRGMADDIAGVLAATEADDLLRQHLWLAPPRLRIIRQSSASSRSSYALVGDAAHAMNPNLGRGACEAIVDSVTLGTLLNTRSTRRALREYQVRRALPGQAVKTASRWVRDLAAMSTLAPVRNALLRRIPGRG